MKFSSILCLIVLFATTACDATKRLAKKFDPSGDWEYVVSNTPMGDLPGTMTLMKEGESWTGKLKSSQGEVDIEDISWEDRMMKGVFYFEGEPMNIAATINEENMMDGKITSTYGDFPITAKRPSAAAED